MNVRLANIDDSASLLGVHVHTWVDSYVGQIPDEFVDELLRGVRGRDWADLIGRRAGPGQGVFALDDAGDVVGFCEFGPTEYIDDDPVRVGHIFRLYVDPPHQGRGGGRLMLDAACDALASAGHGEMTLWTLDVDENRAREFYARLGWVPDGARKGVLVADIRYRRAAPP